MPERRTFSAVVSAVRRNSAARRALKLAASKLTRSLSRESRRRICTAMVSRASSNSPLCWVTSGTSGPPSSTQRAGDRLAASCAPSPAPLPALIRYLRRRPPSLFRVARNPAIFWAACCRSSMGITKQYRRAGRRMGEDCEKHFCVLALARDSGTGYVFRPYRSLTHNELHLTTERTHLHER